MERPNNWIIEVESDEEMLTGSEMPDPPRDGGHVPPLDVLEIEMSSYMKALTALTVGLSNQVSRALSTDLEEAAGQKVKVGDWVRVKGHKRKWPEPKWTGPYEVKEVTSHSAQVKGKSGAP